MAPPLPAGQRLRAGLTLLALVAGCIAVIAYAVSARPVAELPSLGTVPAAALTDQRARPFDPAQLRGSVWIADFIFTRCSGQCPMMSAEVARVAQQTDPAVQLVSFTVDPDWDTPEVLARYATSYHAPERWRFVTGEHAAIERLSREGFHLAAAEPITHSGRLVLVDRQGVIRGYYDPTEPEQMRQLREHVRYLLRRS